MQTATPVLAAQNTRSIIVATAGHVDHGKTSLVQALTGVDTDTLREEKQRGLTINLGFAYSQESLPDSQEACVLGFVDVPGHKDFIHNMLAGVGSIHAALLVIAADDGIMPQTLEHLQILDLLGIENGVVAISKSDTCETLRVEQLQSEIQQLLSRTSLAHFPIIKTSTKTLDGIANLKTSLLALSADAPEWQTEYRHFRYQIDRSFSVKGIGTVVTGTALSGQCSSGRILKHARTGSEFRTRSLRLHQSDINSVNGGERVAINLASAEQELLKRGDWLHDPSLTQVVYRFDSNVRWLADHAPRSGALYHLHIGAAHSLVSVRKLTTDSPWFQIRSHNPLAIHYGDRFILRDPTGSQTLGGGYVVDTEVPRKHRSSPERLALLAALDNNDAEALGRVLDLSLQGVVTDRFRRTRNLTEEGLQRVLKQVHESGTQTLSIELKDKSRVLFARNQFEALSRNLLHCVRQFHELHPSQSGLAEPQLSKELAFPGTFALLQGVTDKLVQLNLLARTGNQLHLPGHTPKVSKEEKFFNAAIRPIFDKADLIPPRTRELADSLKLPLRELLTILRVLEKNGLVIKVADNRYYLPATLLRLATLVEEIVAENKASDSFSVIEFRDRSGIGRNLCIEVLEYFDSRGFTRRDGNSRFLRTDKENIFS
jgi:selenocysteine-specific elongation factor